MFEKNTLSVEGEMPAALGVTTTLLDVVPNLNVVLQRNDGRIEETVYMMSKTTIGSGQD